MDNIKKSLILFFFVQTYCRQIFSQRIFPSDIKSLMIVTPDTARVIDNGRENPIAIATITFF
ncbi:MAG: hypothetical protein QNJ55_13975 [Xenococcus sp. MO_188.B8]|nr:hypothetical protein [Xenococcus sp. MO_188.B8]